MFPIRDSVPSRIRPIVTVILIIVNAVVFGLELTLPAGELEKVLRVFGVVPAALTGASGGTGGGVLGGYASFLTSMFLHGGWLHVIFNMWTLWIFGDNVEDRMGHGRFLLFYLSCGVVAGVVHTLFNLDSTMPMLGASGAIAGVLGAYLLLYPSGRVVVVVPVFFFLHFLRMPAFLYLGIWFLMQVFSGTASLAQDSAAGGVAWWAHVGGFGAGVILHRLFLLKNYVPPGRER